MPRTSMATGWERHIDDACADLLDRVSDEIADDAGSRAPWGETGDLMASYGVERIGKMLRRIGSSLKYATMVELGTRAHSILPSRRKALAWPDGQHPVRRVEHPGTSPYPHLRPALYTKREG